MIILNPWVRFQLTTRHSMVLFKWWSNWTIREKIKAFQRLRDKKQVDPILVFITPLKALSMALAMGIRSLLDVIFFILSFVRVITTDFDQDIQALFQSSWVHDSCNSQVVRQLVTHLMENLWDQRISFTIKLMNVLARCIRFESKLNL